MTPDPRPEDDDAVEDTADTPRDPAEPTEAEEEAARLGDFA